MSCNKVKAIFYRDQHTSVYKKPNSMILIHIWQVIIILLLNSELLAVKHECKEG